MRGRAKPIGRDFNPTIAGAGKLAIGIVWSQGFAQESFDSLRRLGSGNRIDVPGVGEPAFVNGQSISMLKGSIIIKIGRRLHPVAPDSDTADFLRRGQAMAQRL